MSLGKGLQMGPSAQEQMQFCPRWPWRGKTDRVATSITHRRKRSWLSLGSATWYTSSVTSRSQKAEPQVLPGPQNMPPCDSSQGLLTPSTTSISGLSSQGQCALR